MLFRHHACGRAAAWFLAAALPVAPVLAQDTGEFRISDTDSLPPSIVTNEPIDEIILVGAGGDQQRLREIFAVKEGEPVNWLRLQEGLDAVRALEEVGSAHFELVRSSNPTRLVLTLTITPTPETGRKRKFPVLHQDDRSLLTVIANGAFGAYSDTRPWFGDTLAFTGTSPVATDPPRGRSATWLETSVEAGIGGITQIGRSPVYLYGAATGMFTAATGQDLFTDETRSLLRFEKLYAGVIVGKKGVNRTANISVGRQNFNLADGFLISQYSGSANAGPRPGLFLNPRIAFDFAGVADLRFDQVRLKIFYLNPDELEKFESRTEFAGANLTYTLSKGTRFGATYINTVRSNSSFRRDDGTRVDREGINTLAFEGRVQDPFGIRGLWLQSEYSRQWRNNEMRAWAAYGTIGWRSQNGWQPSLSYRYFTASGDDPDRKKFGRYDPLLSGGLGEWVQGVNFKKILGNSNAKVHRIRATVKPSDRVNVTLDFFDFTARQRNNLGGNPALASLASKDLGQEMTARVDWFLTDRLYFLIVGSHAVPGQAIRRSTLDDAKAWTTAQVSAFWRF